MFRSFDIWKTIDQEQMVRYRCFEDLESGKFCVQSADFFRLPIGMERLALLEKQFLELLIEESPFSRSGVFDSIQEAIANHDSEFSEP
jgi:hypothetical protein